MSTVARNAPQGATLPATATALPQAQEDISPYRWFILVGLILSSMMEVLDTTIINVSLPQMAGNLNATAREIAWVSTSYILSNVIVLPMTAFLAGRFGRKRYLIFSILLFITASFFCGTSRTLGELVFWRILQGGGGAALLSTAQATLREIFPVSQMGIVQSIFILGIVVAPTIGPTLGGYITDNLAWAWNFFINIPIGIVSLFLVSAFLEDPKCPRTTGSVDWGGIGLLAVGLGALQYVLEEGAKDDWFDSPLILGLSILSAISLIAMLFWELSPRNPQPVVNFRILKSRELASSLMLFVALGMGLYGGIYLFPLFAQTVLGFTPTQTGMALLPGGIATGISVVVCGRILNGPKPMVDPRLIIFSGMVMFTVSMWMLGHLTTQSGEPDARLALIVRGAALGLLFTPINLIALGSVPRSEVQQASGLINLTRQLGGSFGIAVLGTYVQGMQEFHRTMLSEHIYSGNPALIERQHALEGFLLSRGYSAAQASELWMPLLNQQVTRQAMTMSFNSSFMLILIIFVVAMPMILILRQPKPGIAPAAGGGH